MAFQDKKLTCKQCGQEFIFTANEQEFFLQKNLKYEPKRCKSCRSLKKTSQGGYNRDYSRQLFDVICAKCGKKTQVSFKPVLGRPVYCRLCYQQMR